MRLPGIGLPAMAAITVGAVLLVMLPLIDFDYFWHAKTGEWIVTHGWRLPDGEPFSFTARGSPWVVQGWLFDAVQYVVQQGLGDVGVRAMFVTIYVATWAVVHAAVRQSVRREAHALLLTMVCAAAAGPYMAPRPLAATNLAFALVLLCLLRYRATGRLRWLLPLPAVFALWANLHFGYITGLALIALFAAASLLERHTGNFGRQPEPGSLSPARAILLLLACALAVGLNPYGWSVLTETVAMSGTNMSTDVVEWMSPDFRKWRSQAFLLPIALVFVLRALATRRPAWLDLLVPLALVGAALYSQRHIALASIALAPMMARALADWVPGTLAPRAQPGSGGWRAAGGREIGDIQYPLNLAITIAAVAAALALAPKVSDWQLRRFETMLPVKAADFVIENNLRGPMLNDYHTGGYLIHRLHPDVPVFIDGRYNPYAGQVMRDHDALMRLDSGWQDILDRHDIRLAVLARPHDGLAGAMAASGRFRLVHADTAFGVLIRNDGAHPGLPDVSPPRAAKPERER